MLELIEKGVSKNKWGNVYSRYKCNCGKEKLILDKQVKSAKIKSCGCFRNKATQERRFKHGKCGSREHRSYVAMKSRCTNKNHIGYKNYGGRGISICAEWFDSFVQFYADMGDRPLGTSLDRIDNDGNYEPLNCRWSDRSTQASNRRKNV